MGRVFIYIIILSVLAFSGTYMCTLFFTLNLFIFFQFFPKIIHSTKYKHFIHFTDYISLYAGIIGYNLPFHLSYILFFLDKYSDRKPEDE